MLEVNPSQNANGNVKVITIADNTTHPEKVRTEKLSSCCATVSSVTLPRHRNTCVTGHTSVLLGSHETWMTRKRTNLRTSLVRSPKTSTWHDALKHVFTGTQDDQAEQHDQGTIDEVPGDPYMEQGGGTPEEADREVSPT